MPTNTSWEQVNKWYSKIVGDKGHYYHQSVVIPKTLALLGLTPTSSVLDLACGNGILEKAIPETCSYLGIDSSKSFIDAAIQTKKGRQHRFEVGDITAPMALDSKYTHQTIILALQNVENISAVIKNAAEAAQKGTKLVIVLNHPFCRIPRHSMWEVDDKNNTIYRKLNRYLSLIKIPIQANPSKGEDSFITFSFHFPLSYLSEQLFKNGYSILKIEEWVSDKESVGKHAKRENIARDEFPLFMGILATKL